MAKRYPVIEEIRQVVIEHDYFCGPGPASEPWVRAAEQELVVVFPPSYRHFLREVGEFNSGDRYIHGLTTPDGPGEFKESVDVVGHTKNHRDLLARGDAVVDPGLHPGLIVIGSVWESDAWFFLDTTHLDEEDEGPVLMQGHGVPLQVFAPNFITFLHKLYEEEDPFTEIVQDPPVHSSIEADPKAASEDNRVNRSIVWLGVDPTSPGPPNARFFGLDTDSRDVFVHGKGAGLDLMQQLAASEANAFFFGNPSEIGTTGEPFVAIDYILEHHPEIETADQLREIREAVRSAYDEARFGEAN